MLHKQGAAVSLPAMVAAGWNPMDQNSTMSHSLNCPTEADQVHCLSRNHQNNSSIDWEVFREEKKCFQETLFHFWMIFKSCACLYFCLMCKSSPGVRRNSPLSGLYTWNRSHPRFQCLNSVLMFFEEYNPPFQALLRVLFLLQVIGEKDFYHLLEEHFFYRAEGE